MTSAAAVVLAVTLAQAISVPPPGLRPGVSEAESKGTGVIRGRVVSAETGRPLRRARITANADGVTRATSTNSRGEYEIKELPAGRFTVGVTRSGYMPMGLGQRTPDDVARPLTLVEGQTVEKVDFALPRTGMITGRVVDETGEAVADVSVYAMRYEFARGRRSLVPVGRDARTDDVGRYRLLNVPPGEFLVMAHLRDTWVAGPERHVYAYARSFFPSVAAPADAARVKVALGQESGNVDITLVAGRAAIVSGTAAAADGRPLAGATLLLNVQLVGATGGTTFSTGSSQVAADGSWEIRDVAPGEYQIDVTSSDRSRIPERASMPLTVQGTQVTGIALVAGVGGTVRGLVTVDGGRPLPPNAQLRVMAHGIGPNQPAFGIPAAGDDGRVQAEGRFTLGGVAGPSVLRVIGLPRNWGVERIETEGRDLTDLPVEVSDGDQQDVTIVISDRLPGIQGTVADTRGTTSEAVVVLFPADTARWVDNTAIRSTRPDQAGQFRFDIVRPGDYVAVALTSVVRHQLADPDFLESLRSRGTTISVKPGESEQVSLRVR